MYKTMADIKAANKAHGGCFFEPGTMRFFNSRIESQAIKGHFFITSERFNLDDTRRYTIRYCDRDGDIKTVGKFLGHATKAAAKKFIDTIAF